jgi:hypothetical protein
MFRSNKSDEPLMVFYLPLSPTYVETSKKENLVRMGKLSGK